MSDLKKCDTCNRVGEPSQFLPVTVRSGDEVFTGDMCQQCRADLFRRLRRQSYVPPPPPPPVATAQPESYGLNTSFPPGAP
jgi:hypothetical protein